MKLPDAESSYSDTYRNSDDVGERACLNYQNPRSGYLGYFGFFLLYTSSGILVVTPYSLDTSDYGALNIAVKLVSIIVGVFFVIISRMTREECRVADDA